jgi:hypothetical protein
VWNANQEIKTQHRKGKEAMSSTEKQSDYMKRKG